MTWQRIERGLRRYDGRKGTSYQVLLRAGDGIISETYTNERVARDRLDELRGKRRTGELQHKNLHLGQYIDRWIEMQKVNEIRESSLRDYLYQVGVIKKYFGVDRQLKRISIALIRDFEKHMVTELGLSANRQANIFATLKRILMDAREEQFNVIVPPSKRKHRTKNHSKEIKHLERHELELLLKNAFNYGIFYRDFFEFLAFTGVRVGEALALTWGDVDFVNRKISINKRLYEGNIDEPKSESSNRIIDMFDPINEMLMRRKKAVSGLYMKKPQHRDLDLVFPGEEGEYRGRSFIGRIFKRSLRKAGLSQEFSPHDLRHTCASFLLSITSNLLYVSKHLGHSNPEITLRIYSHLLKEDQMAIIGEVNRVFATFFNKHLKKEAKI